MSMVIECPCGVVLREVDVDHVVRSAQNHARQAHDMELTTAQAQDMAHPE